MISNQIHTFVLCNLTVLFANGCMVAVCLCEQENVFKYFFATRVLFPVEFFILHSTNREEDDVLSGLEVE